MAMACLTPCWPIDGQPNAVYLNGNDQQFGKAVAYGTGTDNTGQLRWPINGDGHLDIVAANGAINRILMTAKVF